MQAMDVSSGALSLGKILIADTVVMQLKFTMDFLMSSFVPSMILFEELRECRLQDAIWMNATVGVGFLVARFGEYTLTLKGRSHVAICWRNRVSILFGSLFF